jgi:hypothetical protein
MKKQRECRYENEKDQLGSESKQCQEKEVGSNRGSHKGRSDRTYSYR